MHYALCINAFHQQLTIVVNAFLPNHQVYGLWLEKRQLSNHWPKYHLDMSPIPQKGQLNAFFRVFDVVAERPLHEWVTFGQMSSRYEPIYSKPLWAAQTVWVRTRLGWTRRGSQLCKSSFSYSTRGDLRSISGWGDQNPGGSSHHTIDKDDELMIGPMPPGHWIPLVLHNAKSSWQSWKASPTSPTFWGPMGFLERCILCTFFLYWVSTRDSYSPPYLHVMIMIRQTLQASDRVCLYNSVARSVSVKIGKEFWYQ